MTELLGRNASCGWRRAAATVKATPLRAMREPVSTTTTQGAICTILAWPATPLSLLILNFRKHRMAGVDINGDRAVSVDPRPERAQLTFTPIASFTRAAGAVIPKRV